MPRFLIDEDMPRSLARVLRDAGFEVEDVRDVGLRGNSDERIFEYAVLHSLVVVTGDLGFANILRFPPNDHAGIVVCRFPNEWSLSGINDIALRGIMTLATEPLTGSIAVIEPSRIRVRKKA
jgi:predicted nuclease of predicted toxin-antitoxin system